MLDAVATVHALSTSAVAFRSVRDVIVADGPEAAAYLHGQMSQQITGLAVGDSTWSLLLSPQGRIDAWVRVTRTAESTFWLDLDSGFGEAALARLERFKLRTKATFDLRSVGMLSVRGPSSPDPVAPTEDSDSVDAGALWGGGAGFDRLGADPAVPDGIELGDPAVFELERIRSGAPRMGAEIGEKTIPAELGIVDRSVDFTKGCYVGQELVARVDSRGNNTPRRMWAASVPEGVPAAGAEVFAEGTSVGVVTSVAADPAGGAMALVSIVRSADVPGPVTIDGSPALVVELPIGS
jgi:folate-binding protein YgfZ